MHVKRFSVRHAGHITGWLNYRGIEVESKELPEIGYIAFKDEDAVAIGFIRRIEGGTAALIDNVVTNPFLPARTRDMGLAMIAQSVILHAAKIKIKHLLVITKDKHSVERAKRLGFIQHKDEVLIKAL